MVLVSKEEKRAIYSYLLREGVLVVKKDPYLTKHHSIEGVHNLKVMMIVKSLKSRGYLNDVYSWKWSYYTVTNKGVNFLVKALGKFQTTILTHFRCPNRCCPRNLQEEEGLSCRCP